jgi:hypothetical protein
MSMEYKHLHASKALHTERCYIPVLWLAMDLVEKQESDSTGDWLPSSSRNQQDVYQQIMA